MMSSEERQAFIKEMEEAHAQRIAEKGHDPQGLLLLLYLQRCATGRLSSLPRESRKGGHDSGPFSFCRTWTILPQLCFPKHSSNIKSPQFSEGFSFCPLSA